MITFDSKPEYGNTWELGAGGWTCIDWKSWFLELANEYGLDVAKQTWLDAWHVGADSIITTVPLDCRTFDSDFKAFLTKYGLSDSVNNIVSKVLGAGDTVVSSAADVVDSTATNISWLSKNMKTIVLVIGVLAILIAVGYLFKSIKK
jgi:hypothetical protein